MDYEWLADSLVDDEYVEGGPALTEADCYELLDSIFSKTGKTHMLIVNVNVESGGVYYDYILEYSEKNTVHIEEWDNRYL